MSNLLVSALVAGAVTILIELLAKPYTELRKDRLLRSSRERDEAIQSLTAYSTRVKYLNYMAGEDDRFRQELDSLEESLREISTSKVHALESMPRAINDLLHGDFGRSSAFIDVLRFLSQNIPRIDHRSEESDEKRKIDRMYMSLQRDMADFAETPLEYLRTPKWRVAKRLSIKRKAVEEQVRRSERYEEMRRNETKDTG